MQSTVQLPANSATPREARRFVLETLEHIPGDVAETIALLTTELVTNAVLHARTSVEVVVKRTDDEVRVEVQDGSRIIPVRRTHSRESATGRGLMLVTLMARQWGVEFTSGGKSVWFSVSLAEAEQAAPDLDFFLSFDDELGNEIGPGDAAPRNELAQARAA